MLWCKDLASDSGDNGNGSAESVLQTLCPSNGSERVEPGKYLKTKGHQPAILDEPVKPMKTKGEE
jgi:hypothetical protein